MSKTRSIVAGVLVAAAVGAAGAAAAHRTQSSQQAAATFAAGTVANTQSRSCTSSDGTYQETTATYTGTATSTDARLNGALKIRAHSVVNTTTGLGWLTGSFRVDGSSGGAHGDVDAVVSSGNVSGTLVGQTGGPEGKLLATIASAFTQKDGFSSGSLGTGSVSAAGIVFQRGDCAKTGKPVRSTYVAGLHFAKPQGTVPNGKADGSFTLDVSRDSSGAVSGATAVFYVNYRFDGGPVTITGLTLNKASDGSVALDSGAGTIVDTDGSGNVTKVVSGVGASLVQALLSSPHDYVVQLSTATGSVRAQLAGFSRH